MNINIRNLVSITQANQNFSKIASMVDENGSVIIMKNNTPRYVLMEFDLVAKQETAEDENLEQISAKIMKQNKEAYKKLAQ